MSDLLIRVIPLAAQPAMPWANGGGSTRQVAIDPADGSLDRGFRWRVSCAQVERDGPFSKLAGVDRSLWLVRGAGMRLWIAGRMLTLDRAFQRVDFRGEDDVRAELLNGTCQDCNVMCRRGEVVAESMCVSLAVDEAQAFECERQALVLVLAGSLRIMDPSIRLETGDAAAWEGSGRIECVGAAPTTALIARFR